MSPDTLVEEASNCDSMVCCGGRQRLANSTMDKLGPKQAKHLFVGLTQPNSALHQEGQPNKQRLCVGSHRVTGTAPAAQGAISEEECGLPSRQAIVAEHNSYYGEKEEPRLQSGRH